MRTAPCIRPRSQTAFLHRHLQWNSRRLWVRSLNQESVGLRSGNGKKRWRCTTLYTVRNWSWLQDDNNAATFKTRYRIGLVSCDELSEIGFDRIRWDSMGFDRLDRVDFGYGASSTPTCFPRRSRTIPSRPNRKKRSVGLPDGARREKRGLRRVGVSSATSETPST